MPPCGHIIVVETGDPFAPAGLRVRLRRAMFCSLFPANNYYLSIEALTADNIHFFTARR
jgi:putative acetyltransferase